MARQQRYLRLSFARGVPQDRLIFRARRVEGAPPDPAAPPDPSIYRVNFERLERHS
jgi:hypothetical protein